MTKLPNFLHMFSENVKLYFKHLILLQLQTATPRTTIVSLVYVVLWGGAGSLDA